MTNTKFTLTLTHTHTHTDAAVSKHFIKNEKKNKHPFVFTQYRLAGGLP